MSNDTRTYRSRKQQSKTISNNATVGIEWYVSSVDDTYSGPLLVLSVPGKTVEFSIPKTLYDEIDENFDEI